MTTEEIRRSETKGLESKQRKQGGVIPSRLSAGTRLYVETDKHIYQLTVVEENEKKTFVVDANIRSLSVHRTVIDINSLCPILRHKMMDWIGYKLRMIMVFSSGITIMTDEVTGVSIEGEDYNYDMWSHLKDD